MCSVPRKPKKLLTAEQKYDLWVRMLTGQISQAQAAAVAGVDRSVIARLRAVARDGAVAALASAKPGRSGQSCGEAGRRGPAPSRGDRGRSVALGGGTVGTYCGRTSRGVGGAAGKTGYR
ncbi:MAG: hypothetical protein KTU85_07845 [Acidimicrobiia bacterium]|nr:hypothetical protein [Acidimicrobiia bacterium]